jgi:hypothetical protein
MPEKTKPFFLFLFPLFFVLHGFTLNFDSVPVNDALLLALKYVCISLVIAIIFWLFFRDISKAGMMVLLILGWQFFFGNVQDFFKDHFHQSFILRYRFIIPFGFLLLLAFFIWLRKTKRSFHTITAYLNILFIILIIVDTGLLVAKIPVVQKNKTFSPVASGFTICDSCSKPDIFLIIPDQYSGNTALKDVFHFDNSEFENELALRGFHVAKKSTSNYNLTPFSVASIFNMDFLELKKGKQNYATVNYSYKVLRNSRVLNFLKASGYEFYNCSIFDFDNKPAHKYKAFLPYGINLVTAQTFTSRVTEDFRADVLEGKFHLKSFQKKIAYENLHFNDDIIDRTQKIAAQRSQAPKFVYTHLMMPHYPYYFDSKGNLLMVEKLTAQKNANPHDYIEYLQYTNKRLIQLVDKILASSPTPPIIIILSDHGLQKIGDRKYDFANLNAVCLPNKNYSLFYDSITNVNQFRIIFNEYFNQHLPLLKDSTINVWD